MAISNPSFEDEDPGAAGFAQFWTLTEVGSDGDAAQYATVMAGWPYAPLENFRGGWNANELDIFAYADPPDVAELEASIYDAGAEAWEDFEEGWNNVPFFLAMGVTSPASFDGNTSTDSDPETWTVTAGQKLDLTTDQGSASSDPVAFTTAYLQAANVSSGPPIGFDAGGETIRIDFHSGRGFVLVTLTPAQIDVGDVGVAINQALTDQGWGGQLTAGIINPGSGSRLFLTTTKGGYGSSFTIRNVSHLDTLQRIGFSEAQIQAGAQGTGNVFLSDEAKAEDIAAIVIGSAAIQAIQSGAVALPDGRVRVWSDPGGTITVDSSGALGGVLGFTLDTVFGPTSFAPEDVEDFEDGYDNRIFYEDGNLLPAAGAQTWTPSSVTGTVEDAQADPFGGTDAFKLTDLAFTGGVIFEGDTVAVAGGSAHRARLWIKKDPTAPQFLEFLMDYNGLAKVLIFVDQANGRVWNNTIVSVLLTEGMLIEAIPGWWRLDLQVAAGVGPVFFQLRASRGAIEDWPTSGPSVANANITVYGARLVQDGAVLEGFALAWTDVNPSAAMFDSGVQNVEDFTGGWLNDSFQFAMGATSSASWDAGAGGTPEAVEDFEETIAPFIAVPDQATDTFTKNTHGLSNGQIVTLTAEGGTLPTGLATGTNYFVIAAAANTFQLSLVSGGAAVNFTDNGSGSLRVTPPATVFWIDLMTTL